MSLKKEEKTKARSIIERRVGKIIQVTVRRCYVPEEGADDGDHYFTMKAAADADDFAKIHRCIHIEWSEETDRHQGRWFAIFHEPNWALWGIFPA